MTHISFAPFASPVKPNFPLPNAPVVELLILLAFVIGPVADPALPTATPLPFPFACPLPFAIDGAAGGREAERYEVG